MKQFSYVSVAPFEKGYISASLHGVFGNALLVVQKPKNLFAMVNLAPMLIDVFSISTMIRIIPAREKKRSDDFDDPLFLSLCHLLIDHILNDDSRHS